MPRHKQVNTMLMLPNGIVDLLLLAMISTTDTGVAGVDSQGRLFFFIPIKDETTRGEVSREISKRLAKARSGEDVEPMDWAKYGLDPEAPVTTKGGSDTKKG